MCLFAADPQSPIRNPQLEAPNGVLEYWSIGFSHHSITPSSHHSIPKKLSKEKTCKMYKYGLNMLQLSIHKAICHATITQRAADGQGHHFHLTGSFARSEQGGCDRVFWKYAFGGCGTPPCGSHSQSPSRGNARSETALGIVNRREMRLKCRKDSQYFSDGCRTKFFTSPVAGRRCLVAPKRSDGGCAAQIQGRAAALPYRGSCPLLA
jgi:hypothetical protein